MKFRNAFADVSDARATSVGTSADSAGPMNGPSAASTITNSNTSAVP